MHRRRGQKNFRWKAGGSHCSRAGGQRERDAQRGRCIGITPTDISPTGITPTGISPTGISPTGISPTGIAEGAGAKKRAAEEGEVEGLRA